MRLTRAKKFGILAGLVIFIVGGSTSASYALWSVNNSLSSTANAGTVSLTANGSPNTVVLGDLNSSQEGPSATATTSVSVKNNGTLALTYSTVLVSSESPSTSVIGDNITYTIWVTGATTSCTSSAAVTAPSWTGNLNTTAGTTISTGRALAAGATEILCVRTLMSSKAPSSIQGSSLSSTLTFTGSNGWTSSAAANWQVSSQTVPAPTFSSCVTDLVNNVATLRWPAAAATLNGSAFKDYAIEWIYSDGPNKGQTILTATRTDPYAIPTNQNLTGNSFVRVTYEYANGWTSGTPTSYNFTRSTDGQNSPVCSPEKAP